MKEENMSLEDTLSPQYLLLTFSVVAHRRFYYILDWKVYITEWWHTKHVLGAQILLQ